MLVFIPEQMCAHVFSLSVEFQFLASCKVHFVKEAVQVFLGTGLGFETNSKHYFNSCFPLEMFISTISD